MKDNNRLHEVLLKYRLAYPVPDAVQEYIREDRDETLKTILKITGTAGLLFWLAIVFKLLLKKLGISISILQGKIIVGVTVAAVATGSTTGTYEVVKYVQKNVTHKKPEVEIIKEKPEEKKEELVSKDKPEKKYIIDRIRYRIGVQPFKGINSDQAWEISDKIASHLEEKTGSDKIINMRLGQGKNVNFMVMGSLIKFGETYTATVKLTNVETGKVEVAFSEDIASYDEMDNASKKIADRILESIRE